MKNTCCLALQRQVYDLQRELEKNTMASYSSQGSCSSKGSGHGVASSCDFPLVLALAATAGNMTSSSEADRSHYLERESSLRKRIDQLEQTLQTKELLIQKQQVIVLLTLTLALINSSFNSDIRRNKNNTF